VKVNHDDIGPFARGDTQGFFARRLFTHERHAGRVENVKESGALQQQIADQENSNSLLESRRFCVVRSVK